MADRPPRTRARLAAFAVAASLFGVGIAAVVAEVLVRGITDETPRFLELVELMSADQVVFRPSEDPELLYEIAPNVSISIGLDQAVLAPEETLYADDPRVIRTNSLGFRDEERTEARTDAFRVLCFGGSNTYGAAVSNENTWPAQLQRELRARVGPAVEVWNLGHDGYNTRQKVRQTRVALERWSPDLLVFQTFNLGPRIMLPTTPEQCPRWALPEHQGPLGGLYREYLLGAPPPGPLQPLFRHSKAWRLAALHANRSLAAQQEPRTRRRPINRRAEEVATELLSGLIQDVDDRVPVVVFIPPAGGNPGHVVDSKPRVVDLRKDAWADLEAIPDLQMLHPGRHAYRWYAEHLAQALVDAECVGRPGVTPPCRLERARPDGD